MKEIMEILNNLDWSPLFISSLSFSASMRHVR